MYRFLYFLVLLRFLSADDAKVFSPPSQPLVDTSAPDATICGHVNALSGNFSEFTTTYTMPGSPRLQMTSNYNSLSAVKLKSGQAEQSQTSWGDNWRRFYQTNKNSERGLFFDANLTAYCFKKNSRSPSVINHVFDERHELNNGHTNLYNGTGSYQGEPRAISVVKPKNGKTHTHNTPRWIQHVVF